MRQTRSRTKAQSLPEDVPQLEVGSINNSDNKTHRNFTAQLTFDHFWCEETENKQSLSRCQNKVFHRNCKTSAIVFPIQLQSYHVTMRFGLEWSKICGNSN